MIRHYLKNLLVAVDQLINTILGGDPDETISSRAAKGARRGSLFWGAFCRVVDWFDPGHCQRTIEEDEGRDAAI